VKASGKAIGFLFGLIIGRGRWPLALLGFFLGHLYDIGVLTGRYRAKPERPERSAAPANEDPYAVLGVAPRVTDAELEQAYRRRMSEYHPDRVASAAKEIRDMADQRAREINQAYDRIKRERRIP